MYLSNVSWSSICVTVDQTQCRSRVDNWEGGIFI